MSSSAISTLSDASTTFTSRDRSISAWPSDSTEYSGADSRRDVVVGADIGSNPSHVSSSASATVDQQRTAAIDELLRYLSFPRGWDGYDGEVFEPELIGRAVRLIEAVVASANIAEADRIEIIPGPIADGRVDLEFICDRRVLELTLDPAVDSVDFYFEEGAGSCEGVARWNSAELDGWMHRLTGADRVSTVLRQASAHPVG